MSQITQKGQSAALALQAGGSFQSSADANLATLVGTRYDLSDGREVILVSVGATALGTAGTLCQDAATISGHQGLVVTAYTPYSANGNVPASVTATLGGTAVVANQYQGGFLLVDSGPGIGQTVRIASHPAGTSSASVVFTLEDAPNTALTTSSTVCLTAPHGANIVIFPTTATGAPVGVTLYPIGAGVVAGGTTASPSFGFLASKGNVAMLSDALIAAAGQDITYSVSSAGSCTLTTGSSATLGLAIQAGVSAKSRAVFVDL